MKTPTTRVNTYFVLNAMYVYFSLFFSASTEGKGIGKIKPKKKSFCLGNQVKHFNKHRGRSGRVDVRWQCVANSVLSIFNQLLAVTLKQLKLLPVLPIILCNAINKNKHKT